MARRRYTKAEKAEAVARATMTSTEAAAEELGIPRRTLGYWMDRPEFAELRRKTQDQVADEFWAVIQLGVRRIADLIPTTEDISKVGVAVGILYDKRALLTGGATGRTESRDITGTISDAELNAALLEADAIATAGGSTPPTEDAPEG